MSQILDIQVKEILTAREAASHLNMSERKLWDLTNRGIIPCKREGRWIRYYKPSLNNWMSQSSNIEGDNHGQHFHE